MKRAFTAFGAGLLALGIASSAILVGTAGAGAQVAAATPVMSATSANTGQTATDGCNSYPATDDNGAPGCGVIGSLSRTAADTFTITINDAVNGDDYEAAVCDSDADQASPLGGIQSGCNGQPNEYNATAVGGVATITVPFKPGKQDTANAKNGGPWPLSGCPPTGTQYAYGVACIVAAADFTEVGDYQGCVGGGGGDSCTIPWTGNLSMSFQEKSQSGTWNDKKGAELKVKGGFATFGLYSNSSLGSPPYYFVPGCQAFSPGDGTPAAWGADPLCLSNDGAATGEGVAAELVAVNASPISAVPVASGVANAGLCPAGDTNCVAGSTINNPGGITLDAPAAQTSPAALTGCQVLLDLAEEDPQAAAAATTGSVDTFAVVGVGLGPSDNYDAASGNTYLVNVTVGAIPKGTIDVCGDKAPKTK